MCYEHYFYFINKVKTYYLQRLVISRFWISLIKSRHHNTIWFIFYHFDEIKFRWLNYKDSLQRFKNTYTGVNGNVKFMNDLFSSHLSFHEIDICCQQSQFYIYWFLRLLFVVFYKFFGFFFDSRVYGFSIGASHLSFVCC